MPDSTFDILMSRFQTNKIQLSGAIGNLESQLSSTTGSPILLMYEKDEYTLEFWRIIGNSFTVLADTTNNVTLKYDINARGRFMHFLIRHPGRQSTDYTKIVGSMTSTDPSFGQIYHMIKEYCQYIQTSYIMFFEEFIGDSSNILQKGTVSGDNNVRKAIDGASIPSEDTSYIYLRNNIWQHGIGRMLFEPNVT